MDLLLSLGLKVDDRLCDEADWLSVFMLNLKTGGVFLLKLRES